MTVSEDSNNINNNENKNENIVEKITCEIKNIEIKEDNNENTPSNDNNENNNTEKETNSETLNNNETSSGFTNLSAAMAAKINNLTTPDGKPKIIAYTTKLDSTSFYDEIDIEDMDFNEEERIFYYPCPCGDRFRITEEEILQGEEIAICPSCSLLLKVIYSPEDFVIEEEEE
ncbi:hypothetical protein RB653_002944 [Dictyostelium firmibasis]|uniref:Diphthamide biosynthesis protein 3 n=1 Tax=Dictyostelium firmibasis TaxID=79012 RepID=A0AAN7YQH7_9MYCE